jgi:hypothetical protein
MNFIRSLRAAIFVVALMASPASADTLYEIKTNCSTTNVTIVTTTETAVITSDAIVKAKSTSSYYVHGWAQLTTGAATTTVTATLRRGTDATGTVIGEANVTTIGAAAGSNEEFSVAAIDSPGDVSRQQYTFTLDQASATGNGTALQACITVMEIQ